MKVLGEKPLIDLLCLTAEQMKVEICSISVVKDGILTWRSNLTPDEQILNDKTFTITDLVFQSGEVLELPDVNEHIKIKERLLKSWNKVKRFYMGVPLRDYKGQVMAVLSIIDTEPRHLTSSERERLDGIVGIAESLLRSLAAESEVASALKTARANEAALRTIFEHLPQAVLSKNVRSGNFEFLVWNKKAEEIFGLKREDVIGKTDYDVSSKLEADYFRKKDLETMALKKVVEIPEEIRTNAMGERSLRTIKIPVHDDKGNPEFLIVLCEDITEIKAQAKEAAKSRAAQQMADQFASLAEAIPQMVWTADANGNIDYANVRWSKYILRDGAGMRIDMNDIHPDHRDQFAKAWDQSIREGLSQFEFKLRIVGTDEFRWQLARATPLLDRDGKIKKWFATSTDIEDQKKIEQELRLVQLRVDAVMGHAPLFLYTIDMNGIVLQQQGRLAGHEQPIKVGDEILSLMSYHAETVEIFNRALKGEYISWEGWVDKNYYQTYLSPIFDPSKNQIGVIGISQDLTAMKTLENERSNLIAREAAALEASRLKSEFLANMSHEIRTPLNGIMGIAEAMRSTSLDAKQTEYLSLLNGSSEILLSLVNDVLDLSKIETGQVSIEEAPFSPLKMVETVRQNFHLLAERKGIELKFILDEKLPAEVRGDLKRTRQVLMSLVGNALKFTEKGQVNVTLDWSQSGVMKFRVTDTGIGIAPDIQPQLFKSFTQGDASMTKKYGGTGLGLVISKHLVELMLGSIGMTSTLGKGSEFWFNVPCLEIVASKEPKISDGGTSANKGGKTRILLVEDNEVNRVVVTSFLATQEYEVVHADNGKIACEKFQDSKFDLVLMDCQMPVMGGLEATRIIRGIETKSGSHTPIVAITANAMEGDRENCLQAGMDDYLPKPIRKQVLLETVDRWLKTRAAG